jgi:hypothetical protein
MDITLTPLFQTNFFPDFIQVYLYPPEIEVEFKLEQTLPAFTAAFAVSRETGRSKIAEQRTARNDFPLLMG